MLLKIYVYHETNLFLQPYENPLSGYGFIHVPSFDL
jgi:hypothetical protein